MLEDVRKGQKMLEKVGTCQKMLDDTEKIKIRYREINKHNRIQIWKGKKT